MADASFATPNPTVGGRLGAVVYEGSGDGRCDCALSHNYHFAIGPRLSAAYQIDTKTVLRAGAGISYGVVTTPQGSSYSVADFYTINPAGYGISPLLNTGGLAGGNPYAAGNPYGNPELTWPNFDSGKYPTRTVDGLPPQTPFIYYNPNNRPGRIVSWSFGVQREVMRDLVIDVSYVGNRGAWFYAPKLDTMATNGLTPDRLAQFGIDFNNAYRSRAAHQAPQQSGGHRPRLRAGLSRHAAQPAPAPGAPSSTAVGRQRDSLPGYQQREHLVRFTPDESDQAVLARSGHAGVLRLVQGGCPRVGFGYHLLPARHARDQRHLQPHAEQAAQPDQQAACADHLGDLPDSQDPRGRDGAESLVAGGSGLADRSGPAISERRPDSVSQLQQPAAHPVGTERLRGQ